MCLKKLKRSDFFISENVRQLLCCKASSNQCMIVILWKKEATANHLSPACLKRLLLVIAKVKEHLTK